MKKSNFKRIISILCSVSLLLSIITANGVISASADGESNGFKWQLLTGEAADVRCLIENNKLGDNNTTTEAAVKKLSTLEEFGGPDTYTGYLWNSRANGGDPKYQETYSVTTEEAHSGNKSLKYTGRTERTDTGNADLWVSSTHIEPETDYYVTFWAKGDVDDTIDFTIGNNSNNKLESFKIDSEDWKQYTFKIYSGNQTEIVLLIRDFEASAGKTVYYDDFQFFKVSDAYIYGYIKDFNAPEFDVDAEAIEKFTVLSADVETDTGWLNDGNGRIETGNKPNYYSITEEEAHSGTRSLKYTSETTSWESVSLPVYGLKKNTDYTVSFWAKGSSTATRCWLINQWPNKEYRLKGYLGEDFVTPLNADWTQYRYIMNTGDYDCINIALLGEQGTMYFDDFSCVETALTHNSKFTYEYVEGVEAAVRTEAANNKLGDAGTQEYTRYKFSSLEDIADPENYSLYLYDVNPKANKSWYQETYSVTEEEAHSGTHSLKYVGRTEKTDSNTADLWVSTTGIEKYTDYYFTFWAKGDVDDVNDFTIADGSGKKLQSYKIDSEDWKQYTLKIYTGNQTSFTVLIRDFEESAGKTIYYDDIQVFKASDAVTTTYVVGTMDGPFTYEPEDNLIKLYPGLENVEKYTDWLYNIGNRDDFKLYYSVTDEDAHTGSYSLKYSDDGQSGKPIYISVNNLTPNTEYVVSFWTKGSTTAPTSWKFLNAAEKEVNNYIRSGYSHNPVEENWTQHTYVLNNVKDKSFTLVLNGAGGNIYFDDFVVVEKSKITLPETAPITEGGIYEFFAGQTRSFEITAPWYFTKPYMAAVTDSNGTSTDLVFEDGVATFTAPKSGIYSYDLYWSKAEYEYANCFAFEGEKMIEIATAGNGYVTTDAEVISSATWNGMTRLIVDENVESINLAITPATGESVISTDASGNGGFDKIEDGVYTWTLDVLSDENTAEITFSGDRSFYVDAYDMNGDNSIDVRDIVRLKKLAVGASSEVADRAEADLDRDSEVAGATDLAMVKQFVLYPLANNN